MTTKEAFKELINNERKFIETLLVVENKQRQRVPFRYNPIQADADATETGMDIWVKPSSVGFSTERIAKRLVNTLTTPGTNTVLVAYEDFITERLLNKVNFFYNHLETLRIPGFPEIHHSCLPYHAKIQLADGTFRQIGQIVNKREQVKVLSHNMDNGKIESKSISRWYKYPSSHSWINLGSGFKFSHMMTGNHPIWTDDGWKTAKESSLGDITYHNGFMPNEDQKQMILGTMLGDGYHDGHGGICFGQSVWDYIKFKYDMVQEFSSDIKTTWDRGGFSSENPFHTFRLGASPLFDTYSVMDLDVRGLAIWYCDDGSYGRTVNIHTECFTETFHEILIDVLRNNFGIESHIVPHGDHIMLNIPNPRGSGNQDKFFTLIAPYIPRCMEYKLAEQYRGRQKYVWDNCFGRGLVPYKIGIKETALTFERIYNYVYNIEVEDNHNYFTSIGLCRNSTYEKTFRFMVNGTCVSESSIYIASARSKTAGRAEVIHHLLLDEHAFYVPQASENIVAPAMARVPPGGTVDSFSTPNGEENDFHDWYVAAKGGNSIFTAHFYPWWLHLEYAVYPGDARIRMIPETDREEFKLTLDEETLMTNHDLTWAQIRWRRYMMKVMDSLRRKGESRTLFPQEFPEDDLSCFLTTGDMYYETEWIEKLAKTCYDAPHKVGNANIWYLPKEGKQYLVVVDPSQAKITQSAISVLTFEKDALGNTIPIWCARDCGWYSTEDEYSKACKLSDYYNRAMLVWEANGHGLAFTVLAKNRRPIYFREDLINGMPTMMPGWYTSSGKSGTKEYMLGQVRKHLPSLICHDIELVRQLRNFRYSNGKVEIVGTDDVHDTLAIGLSVFNPNPVKRGLQGHTGYKKDWGNRDKQRRRR
ncbi:MAG: hypothetical protein WC364_05740 [Eubacteriales bacterium]|jgi:hypothetical protein